jgi:hypothetical protein
MPIINHDIFWLLINHAVKRHINDISEKRSGIYVGATLTPHTCPIFLLVDAFFSRLITCSEKFSFIIEEPIPCVRRSLAFA